MSEKTDKMLEEIDKLTVVELSDLVKGIEDKYGVTATAVAAPATGTQGADAASSDEKSEYTVVLKEIGDNKLAVIKVARDVTGLGLKDAKDLVDGAPSTIKENVPKDEAEDMKAKFVEAGAVVDLQ